VNDRFPDSFGDILNAWVARFNNDYRSEAIQPAIAHHFNKMAAWYGSSVF
jgi:hypothetical protein